MRVIAGILTALALLLAQLVPAGATPQAEAPQAGAQTTGAEATGAPQIKVYLFWHEGCPYCAAARRDLDALADRAPDMALVPLELDGTQKTEDLFIRAVRHFALDQAAVPLVVIGEKAFLGYLDRDRSTHLYREAIAECRVGPCPDIIAALSQAGGESTAGAGTAADARGLIPQTVWLPVIGEVASADLSLPALTVLLAAIDGFNPCAMWVLVFLIGLLLGLKDEKRMWVLGGAFLLATGVMYFLVMVAWLNLVLLIGAVVWVRAAIGVLAIAGGLFYLREYWANPEAACRVTNPSRRQKIMAAFRKVVEKRQLALAVIGIMALAVMVNFIELICSAGIPAVFTQILALSDLSPAAYYGYVALYILIFMLDDIAIFATAMIALKVTGLTGTYARVSHLIGGVVLLIIGAVMLLRPDLLSFS